MANEGLLPADALEKNAPRPIPPLAGFWFRLGALAIDIFLLRIVFQLTFPLLRTPALQMGSWSVFLGVAVAFIYLFLAEGPVGKGVTVGKAILGIRTTSLLGEPLSPAAAAVRAALLMVLAVPFLCAEWTGHLVLYGNQTAIFFAAGIANGLARAYIVANAFLCVLHPFKQGVHDLAAGSLVLREAGAHNLPAFMEQAAVQASSLRRRALQVSGIAFAALSALHGFSSYRQIFSADAGKQIAFIQSFAREFRSGPFEPFYQPTRLDVVLKWLAEDNQTTTDPLSATVGRQTEANTRPTSDAHVIAIVFRARTAVRPDIHLSSDTVDSLAGRAVRWSEQQITEGLYPFDRESRTRASGIFQPKFLAMVFVEQCNLLLYGQEQIIASKVKPMAIPVGFYRFETEQWLMDRVRETSETLEEQAKETIQNRD
ncbi:MAG: RDD family protein [Candidatus Sumerlaeia bacterium]|nr:RDD family protein [Candidatus Sumerlaeia bacterium]